MSLVLERWKRWHVKSINRRILAAIISVGGFTIVVKLAAIAKQLVIASHFGTSDALDAFLIAFLVPSFAINVAAGSFSAAVIPTFIEVRERKGHTAAQRLFSSVMGMSIFFLLAISAILASLAPYYIPIIGSGFSPEKQSLACSLLYVTLPLLFINGLALVWISILNAEEKFALAAFVPIMTPVVAAAAILIFGGIWGIYALAIGTLGGATLEATLLAGGLKRKGYSLLPRWYGLSPAVKQVVKQYAPMAAGALLMSGTEVIDQSMAAMLGSGSVSALSYGNKMVSLVISIGSLSLGTAIFPHFSRMVASNDWKGIQNTVKTYARLIGWVSVPATLFMIYLSKPMVAFLFERGAFTAGDAHLVGKVQALYLIQVPFYLMGIMGVRLLSALKKNHILMVISGVNLMTNVIGNYVFMHYLGLPGISLSTSVVYLISMVLIYAFLRPVIAERYNNG
ncbi:MAG: murein biosynthesis integral membrane protein MurJ [Thermodesulfobacteriota bacterium]